MTLPPVSIVIPYYGDEATFAACLRGVLERTRYPDWDVIVISDGANDPVLASFQAEPRVRILHRSRGGVARSLNAGFAEAGTRDVVRLHADVVIESPDWLERLAEAAHTQPNAGVIGARLVFPDGRIQAEGRSLVSGAGMHLWHRDRKAFAPEGGSSKVYEVDAAPGALAYYRRDCLTAVGGLDENFGPAWTEDDDFCIGARFCGFKVYVHPGVTGVHYTRTWAPSSTLAFPDTEAVVRHLTWQGKQVAEREMAEYWEAKWGWDPYYPDLHEIRRLYGHTEICWQIGDALRWKSPAEFPTVDCCLVTWNTLPLLKRCLESLARTDYPRDRIRVYITNNASTDGTEAYLDELAASYPFPLVVQHLAVNTGSPVGLNFAVVAGTGDLVARLDDDIVLPPNWLQVLVADLKRRPYAGCIGPKILNDDARQSIQCGAYRHFPGLYGHEDEADLGQADYLARATHVRGCCNLYRRDVFKRCGLLDGRYSPSQFDDPDHHIALLVAGYEILYDGRVGVVHKLNNGLARSHAALANQRGNGGKMYGKWGSDIFEVLERSIDLSREGRYLPDDGDTTALMATAPRPELFPRRHKPRETPGRKTAHEIHEMLARAHRGADLNTLAAEHIKLAAGQRRDGFPRQALDTLHTAANFAPHVPQVLRALAETYRDCGQPEMARTIARRGLYLAPEDPELRALSTPAPDLASSAPTHSTPARSLRINDRSDYIGEAQVSVAHSARRSGTPPRLRVLMVNSFENRIAGGDMHQLKKTRQYLEQLGVQVDVCCSPRPDPRGYDLVHVWNLWFPHQTLAQVKAVRAAAPHIPIVLSTIYWDMAEKAWADVAIPEVFANAANPDELERSLALIAADKLRINGRKRSNAGEPNYRGFELYQRRLVELVDHLLPQSRAEVKNLEKTLGVCKPFTLVFNGAETAVFDQATPDAFVERFKVRDFVLTVGLVEARKNQLMLLHALRDTGLPVVVVGRNYDRNYLRLCQKHSPKGTLFIEHLPHEQLASAYKAARVHALPSWMECAAFVNVEAALCGCALAVSDRTSEKEYFGHNAYYCDPADVRSIRDAVVRAHANFNADAPKRAQLRDLFRTRYTWQQAAEKSLEGYEAALAARRTGSPVSVSLASAPPATSPTPVPPATPAATPIAAPATPVDVSVVIPVFNRLDLTRQCLDRLQRTTSRSITEIIVVNNGSTDGTGEFLAAEAAAGRLRVVGFPENRGFARACNEGARQSRGRYVLFLNNDTEVQPGWLDPLVQLADADPTVGAVGSKLLFSDGTIQHAGVALGEIEGRDPLLAVHTFYKAPADLPAANQRRCYQALTAACLLVRATEFAAIQGFDEGYWNGYEDVDLCLRLQARGQRLVYEPASVVVHHESQSGPARFAKVQENIRRLHAQWLGKVRLDVTVTADGKITPAANALIQPYPPTANTPVAPTAASPTPTPTPTSTPFTSIIILGLNQLSHTRTCLESLARHTPEPHEVILVDNGSTDGTTEYFRDLAARQPHVRAILNRTNRGFAAGNNQGLALARGEVVVLLNNDTVVTPGWLGNMLAVFRQHPQAGVLGPRSNRVLGKQQVDAPSYTSLDQLPAFATDWARQHAGQSRRANRVVGFCLVARRAVLDRIGGLDEQFGSGNFEDDDYCVRAHLAGFESRIVDDSFVHHVGNATFNGAGIDYGRAMMTNWSLFKQKWGIPAETPTEPGYLTPEVLPPGASLRFPLPDLNLSHEAGKDGRCWTDRTLRPPATPATAPRIATPACARIGSLTEARARFAKKQLPEAWTSACAALAKRPFHPEAYLLLAEIALAAGDSVAARRCAQHARDLAPGFRPAKMFLKSNVRGNQKHPWIVLPPALAGADAAAAKPRLSVCLIVRNEERFLGQCLTSVRGLADQIVVVDTGSQDRTVAIAKEHGAEVHAFPWCDDFAAARNASLEHATGDWVLVLDADEELPPERHEAFRKLLRTEAVVSWRLPIQDAGREADGCSYVPRLFRNAPGAFFLGRVHEQAFTSLEALRKEWGLESRLGDAPLRHHGYTAELTRDRDKITRNLRLLEQALVEMPGETGLLMNYGLELTRSGRVEEGLQQYRAAFEAMSEEPPAQVVPEAREMLLVQFCAQLMAAKRHAEVVRVLTSPLARHGGLTASLHFTLGLAYMELKQFAEAAEQMRQCLAKRSRPALTPVNAEVRKAGPRHCLAVCLWKADDLPGAEREFALARLDDPESVAVALDHARFLHDTERSVEALQVLHALTNQRPDLAAPWLGGGQIALSRPEFLEVAVDWTTEARQRHPADATIQAQHAEALLLAGQFEEALPLWRCLAATEHPVPLAALVLCETAVGPNECVPPPSVAGAVAQEFVQWYRKLLQWGVEAAVLRVNEGASRLDLVLPRAAQVLHAVVAETAVPAMA